MKNNDLLIGGVALLAVYLLTRPRAGGGVVGDAPAPVPPNTLPGTTFGVNPYHYDNRLYSLTPGGVGVAGYPYFPVGQPPRQYWQTLPSVAGRLKARNDIMPYTGSAILDTPAWLFPTSPYKQIISPKERYSSNYWTFQPGLKAAVWPLNMVY